MQGILADIPCGCFISSDPLVEWGSDRDNKHNVAHILCQGNQSNCQSYFKPLLNKKKMLTLAVFFHSFLNIRAQFSCVNRAHFTVITKIFFSYQISKKKIIRYTDIFRTS